MLTRENAARYRCSHDEKLPLTFCLGILLMRSPTPSRERSHTTIRRWCVPPVLLRASTETLDGSPILDEFQGKDGDLGVFLWQAVRDVLLWAETPPEERASLFGPMGMQWRRDLIANVHLADQITPAVGVLLDVVEKPGKVAEDWVSRACVHLAHWARGRGALGSALWFAQAGALSTPRGGAAALEAGRLAAARGDEHRAEAWFRRATGVSRRSDDWPSYTRAYIELAALYAEQGDYMRARRHYLRAMRTARRKALRESRATAAHGLVSLFARIGDFAAADQAGRIARLAYGAEHARIPLLMQDMARMWVAAGQSARAHAIVQDLLTRQTEPEDRMQILALGVRAVSDADVEDRTDFTDSFTATWDLVRDYAPGHARNQALSDLALAALAAGEPRLVERVAQAAGVRVSFRTDIEEQVQSILHALADLRPSAVGAW